METTHTFQVLILLLVVISAVAVVARRIKVPPAILLVVTGAGLALVPGLPTVQLAPDLVLVLVLPPLVYSSAVAMSWKEFRFNLRPIALLAVGCVLFTAAAVATATHFCLDFPGRSASCSAPSFLPPTPSLPCRSRGECSFRGESWSCSKGREWRTTQLRLFSTVLRSPPSVSEPSRSARLREVSSQFSLARLSGALASAGSCFGSDAGSAIPRSRSCSRCSLRMRRIGPPSSSAGPACSQPSQPVSTSAGTACG